jgi:hypothetical protein
MSMRGSSFPPFRTGEFFFELMAKFVAATGINP